MTDTKTAAEAYVRSNECELSDTYSAHEESFLAGVAHAQGEIEALKHESKRRFQSIKILAKMNDDYLANVDRSTAENTTLREQLQKAKDTLHYYAKAAMLSDSPARLTLNEIEKGEL